MEFNSLIFITIFFPIVAVSYFFIKDNLKNFWLLIWSFIFYAWGNFRSLCFILILALCNYIFGILIYERKRKKAYLIIGMLINCC